MLTQEEIISYQSIYREVYHTEISYEEAREQGTQLIIFLETVYKPSH